MFLEGLQAEAIGHVGADVGEVPHLGLPALDRDARMDLAGDGEDPPLVGTLLAPALAGDRDSIDVRQLAVARPAHHQLAAAILSRVGLVAKGLVRRSIARIGSQRELDQPEPRFARSVRTILQLRNLDVLETQVSDLEGATGCVRSALGLQLLALRFLIPASGQPCNVWRSGDATVDVGGVPEITDGQQPGKAIRYLPLRQAVRMRVEPVHPARMVGGDHVAVADVAVLEAHQLRSGTQRTGISRRIRAAPRLRSVCMACRAGACSGRQHEDAIAIDATATCPFESRPLR